MSYKKYIDQLLNGTFGYGKNFENDFFDKNKVPPEWLDKKWTFEEIQESIKRFALYHTEGYWPEDKDKLTLAEEVIRKHVNWKELIDAL